MYFLIGCSTISKSENINQLSTDNEVKESVIQEELIGFELGKPAIISGTGNKEHTLLMEDGGYRFVIKTKDDSKILKHLYLVSKESGISIPMYMAIYAGKDESGWYVYETVEHKYFTEELVFDIEADGTYEIEVYKLPEINKISLPITIKEKGSKVIGPFESDGEINIKMQSFDTKLSGFIASIKDAVSGQPSGHVFMNITPDGKEFLEDFNITRTIVPEGSGTYYLNIMANGSCDWEVSISE